MKWTVEANKDNNVMNTLSINCVVAAWTNHEAEIRGYLTRQLGDARLAEDLLQDTFVKAMAAGAKFCSLENPRAWLFRVAKNCLIDHLRRKPDFVEIDDQVADHEKEIAAVVTLSSCLPTALALLSEEDREVISLCDLEGMNQAEYATRKSISVPGAKSRIQRARGKLKTQLNNVCQVQFDESGNICCFSGCKPTDKK